MSDEEATAVAATPAAVAHAEATGVDLTQVEGSGANGTVTKADVVAAAVAVVPAEVALDPYEGLTPPKIVRLIEDGIVHGEEMALHSTAMEVLIAAGREGKVLVSGKWLALARQDDSIPRGFVSEFEQAITHLKIWIGDE